jgi:UDP-2,3-diacylglucosamine hydrolase
MSNFSVFSKNNIEADDEQYDFIAPLGIIAGSGDLPRQMIKSLTKKGRPFFIVAIEGDTDKETTDNVPHIWINLGAIGEALEALKQAGVKELVLAGKINRPSLKSLRPDAMGAKLMAKLGFALFGGDSAIFKTIVSFLEEHGFIIIGTESVMEELITPTGPIGHNLPDKQAQKDIELGAKLIKAIGEFDVGQAVIVKNGLVLGIEAAEGTDAMIERCALIKGEGKGGVLIKASKPLQENRVDLPTIGDNTLALIHKAGFSGIALEAGKSQIVNRNQVIQMADNMGLFIIGFSLED